MPTSDKIFISILCVVLIFVALRPFLDHPVPSHSFHFSASTTEVATVNDKPWLFIKDGKGNASITIPSEATLHIGTSTIYSYPIIIISPDYSCRKTATSTMCRLTN